jgi:hypothetical protein
LRTPEIVRSMPMVAGGRPGPPKAGGVERKTGRSVKKAI